MDVSPSGLPIVSGSGPPVTGGRAVAVIPGPPVPVAEAQDRLAGAPSPAPGGPNVRAASPREMVNLSLDLYAEGMIDFDEYAALAFQPELHPDYDKTVGALTGEPAQPDRRRDYVKIWEEQLQFELRHGAGDSRIVRQTTRIRDTLEQLADPTNVQA